MDMLSRSKSTREVVMITHPSNMHDLMRSYSSSEYSYNPPPHGLTYEVKIKKAPSKSKTNDMGSSSSSSYSSSSKQRWNFLDPEMQRKKRVAGYKSYAVEGKMKGYLRKSFRWISNTCDHLVHGIW